ncbi:hypothetical protein M0R72_14965 [Candidatus Pacearchaeota archaeon]|jgi:hypothetical protein|nr:hypothetical protein [Candidatus Pacearchaeota archaeon]
MVDTAVASSYITTIEDLEARIGADPRSAAIALKAADSTTQTWYLQKATKIIDALPLKGSTYNYIDRTSPSTDEQERQFPRVINERAVDWDDDTSTAVVPEDVKDACVEEAIALYDFYVSSPGDQKRRKLQDQGVKSFSVGKLSESYGTRGTSSKWKGLHSQEAYDLMKQYIAGAVRPIP